MLKSEIEQMWESVIECISEYDGLYSQRVLLVPRDICGYFNKCKGWWVDDKVCFLLQLFLDDAQTYTMKEFGKVDFRDLITKNESMQKKSEKFTLKTLPSTMQPRGDNFSLSTCFFCHLQNFLESKVTDLSRCSTSLKQCKSSECEKALRKVRNFHFPDLLHSIPHSNEWERERKVSFTRTFKLTEDIFSFSFTFTEFDTL